MSNMGYCRFQNTLSDLEDCAEHLEDDDLSAEEVNARKRPIKELVWAADLNGGLEDEIR